MFWERLEVCIKHFWKIQLSRIKKTFIKILSKHDGKGKSALPKSMMTRSELETMLKKLRN